jgi:site-specific DNA-methyltransferase (adenine-specific)
VNDESSTALAKLSAAEQALNQAQTLEELKPLHDVFAAAVEHAKQAHLGMDEVNRRAELKLRTECKAGIWLAELQKFERGRPARKFGNVAEFSEHNLALQESDTTKRQASRWQAIGTKLPETSREEYIVECKTQSREITTAGALRLLQSLQREKMRQTKTEPDALPENEYRIWYADPPWQYGDSGLDEYGHAERHYPTMSIEELEALGPAIQEHCAQDAVLFLWVTSPLLVECFAVIDAWGFIYKASFVWDKVRHNFGHYNSVRHELLLVCTRGSCLPDEPTLFDSVQTIERTEHSVKPDEFRTIIDTLYAHGRRIELFARRAASGWDRWGNEPT